MDFTLLNQQRGVLEQELVTLKENPLVQVPTILKLVELEITRLNEILEIVGPDDMHVDEDGEMMIDRVANEFELTDATPVDDSQSQVGGSSSQVTSEGQGSGSSLQPHDPRTNMEWRISIAIDTITRYNPQDLCADNVTKLLRPIVKGVNVDEEAVQRLIFQKCEEAIESHKKESAQEDQGGSRSKQD